MLHWPVTELKGVGKVRAAAFEKLGVTSVRELLALYPRDYQDFSRQTPVCALQHGMLAALRLTVASPAKLQFPGKGLRLVTALAQDETGRIRLAWFNQPYRMQQVREGDTRVFCGRVDASHGLRLINSDILGGLPGIVPLYPLTQGLRQGQVRDAMAQAAAAVSELPELFPERLRTQYGLCGIGEAVRGVHFPESMEALAQAKNRLSFEDMLLYLLAIALLKQEREGRQGIAYEVGEAGAAFLRTILFTPTGAQLRVMREIADGMQAAAPMNRLVQGDVGAGKTILAFFAMHIAAHNGCQSALMAPTELLARQHYAQLSRMYGGDALLLHGGMRKKEREAAYARVADGSARYIVGTHALLQPGLRFHRLGLVIADEQHRFGVRQRAVIFNKAETAPDMLIMSATPIPRTLAMLLYGDLDVSVVDELPPGRRPVMTRLVPPNKRADMYGFIQRQAREGRQAYVVCPLVEQSGLMEAKSAVEVYEELKAKLPGLRVGLLHGRMSSADKEAVLTAFRVKELDMLVSTTVVEVGVDIPNATVMAIENADRFGLAQLHQLRGRVGRGAAQSFCFLLPGSDSEAVLQRMQIMTHTNDGFEIAQKDLELRGPGEFLGTRQHGVDALQAAQMAASMDVLLMSKLAAEALLKEGAQPDTAPLFAHAKAIYESRMREIANN